MLRPIATTVPIQSYGASAHLDDVANNCRPNQQQYSGRSGYLVAQVAFANTLEFAVLDITCAVPPECDDGTSAPCARASPAISVFLASRHFQNICANVVQLLLRV